MPRSSYSAVYSKWIGGRIRTMRNSLHMTQADVARRMGVQAPYIAALEAGRENLTIGQLAAVATAMGVGFDVRFIVPKREYKALEPDQILRGARG